MIKYLLFFRVCQTVQQLSCRSLNTSVLILGLEDLVSGRDSQSYCLLLYKSVSLVIPQSSEEYIYFSLLVCQSSVFVTSRRVLRSLFRLRFSEFVCSFLYGSRKLNFSFFSTFVLINSVILIE